MKIDVTKLTQQDVGRIFYRMGWDTKLQLIAVRENATGELQRNLFITLSGDGWKSDPDLSDWAISIISKYPKTTTFWWKSFGTLTTTNPTEQDISRICLANMRK